MEDLEVKNPTVFKGHRERGGDVVAKMEAALQTRFGTSLLSTTDDDQESDRLATIGVIISFYLFICKSCHLYVPNFTTLLLNTISLQALYLLKLATAAHRKALDWTNEAIDLIITVLSSH